jgi:hypothetical protein
MNDPDILAIALQSDLLPDQPQDVFAVAQVFTSPHTGTLVSIDAFLPVAASYNLHNLHGQALYGNRRYTSVMPQVATLSIGNISCIDQCGRIASSIRRGVIRKSIASKINGTCTHSD